MPHSHMQNLQRLALAVNELIIEIEQDMLRLDAAGATKSPHALQRHTVLDEQRRRLRDVRDKLLLHGFGAPLEQDAPGLNTDRPQ